MRDCICYSFVAEELKIYCVGIKELSSKISNRLSALRKELKSKHER